MLRYALLVATVLGAAPGQAGETPLYAPAPDWVEKAPLPPAAKLADAPPLLIIDLQQKLEKGELWAYVDTATRISSSQMLNQAGTLAVPWMPNQGDLIIHRAQIVRDGKEIDLLANGKHFTVLRREQELEQLKMTGLLTATMTAEGLRVGDVLRLSASITRKDGALDGHIQTIMPLVPKEANPGFARLRLLWPQEETVKYKTFVTDITPKVLRLGKYNAVEIPVPLGEQPPIPTDAPARFRRPTLLEASTFADWASVSRVMAPLYRTEGLVPTGSAIASQVDAIVKAHATPRARATAALRLVQDEVRYMFNGMDGGNYVPQAPESTWTLRYGDCKAKTLLLLAMLDRMGIEAEAVLASSNMGDLAPERLPSAAAFDHVIVRAVIDGKSFWLDGTISGTRDADLANTPAFRNVLPLRTEGAALLPLPMHADARPGVVVDLEVDQSAGIDLPTPYKMTVTMRGQMAEMMQAASTQASREQRQDLIREMVSRSLRNASIADHDLSYDTDDARMTVTATGIASDRWDYEEGRYRAMLDTVVSGMNFAPDRARAMWKTMPVATADPATAVFRTRVKLPAGSRDFVFEGDTKLPATLAGVMLERSAAIDGQWITVEDRLRSDGREIAPADIPAARAAFAQASARTLRAIAPVDTPARWQLAMNAPKGRFAPLMAMYDKVIRNDPDELDGYRNRAAFLDGIHDYAGAIPDLDRIIAKEPDVNTYLWRARLHINVNDDAKAMADIEAAEALDPANQGALGNRLWLYQRGGKIDEALALIDERIASAGKDKPYLLGLKSEALARAGQTEAAIAASDAAVDAGPANSTALNARCWQKATLNVSLDTALKDCSKAIELAENPAGPLDSRALVYYRMGRMEEARADLDAALAIDRSLDASLYLRGAIRKRAGDTAGGNGDIAAARMINPRMEADYKRWDILP